MDKDSGHYCYETYPSVTKTNTNSLKSTDSKMKKKKDIRTCNCFGSKKRKAFLTGLATNIGICILLFGYTLIGSVVFLAIEGGSSIQHHILATTSMATNMNYKKSSSNNNSTNDFKSKTDGIRDKTVENIWDITVNLNILYRDNWTRLAAQEITRFQDELLKSLAEDYQEFPVVERKVSGRIIAENYEWTFARSFLYSLTVLTTIGTLKVKKERASRQ